MSEKIVNNMPASADPETRLFIRQSIEAATLQIARRIRQLEERSGVNTGERPDIGVVPTVADLPSPQRGGVCFVLTSGKWYYCAITGVWESQ